MNNLAYVSDIKKNSSASKLFSSQATVKRLHGVFITKVNGAPVFTQEEVLAALHKLSSKKIIEFDIEFAPERCLDTWQMAKALIEHSKGLFNPDADLDQDHMPELTIDCICAIAWLRYIDDGFSDDIVSDEEIVLCVNAIQSREMTEEEEALGAFTQRKLKTLTTWPEWQAGEFKQLDRFEALHMFGKPIPRPKDPHAIVL